MKSTMKIFTILFATFGLFICFTGVSWYKLVSDRLMQQAERRALNEHESLVYITKDRIDDILDPDKRIQVEDEVRQTLQSDYIIGTESGYVVLGSHGYDQFGPLEVNPNLEVGDVWLKTYKSETRTVVVSQERIQTKIKPMSINLRFDLTDTVQVIDDLFKTVLGFMLFGMFGSGVLAYFLARYVVKPTESLVGAIDRIREGDMETLVNVENIDNERVAQVAGQFNDMMLGINQQLHDLSNANQTQTEFIQGLSHEIKTPLTSILGNTNLLLSEVRDPKHQEMLGAIYSEATRLKSLSISLLKIYQDDHHALRYETIDETWLETKSLFILNGWVESDVSFENVKMEVDTSLIYIALLNLITNAKEAIGPHQGIIHVQGIDQDKTYRMIITNEIETRLPDTHETQDHNFGLGLTLVQKICDLHMGTLHYSFEEKLKYVEIILPKRSQYEG